MIDTNYLNSYQKDFNLEVNEIKFLITLQNELKINFQSLKHIIEAESRTIETFSKSLSSQVFSFLNDSSLVNDDPTNCLKFSNVFISVFNNFATLLGDENANLNTLMSKINKEISEEYNFSTKNLLEHSNTLFKDLNSNKTKYKIQMSKAEKNLKEIENSINYRRKIDIEKNPSGKIKTDEKIVSFLNDLDENKGHLLIIFDNIKRDELGLNDLINIYFQNSIKFTLENINKLKNYCNLMVKQKIEINNKIKNNLIQGLETLNLIELDFNEHYEKKFSDLKNIKYDDIENINMDDPSHKLNFTTIHESISNYMNCFTMCVSIRKKILNFLFKFFNDILKHSENFITNYQKLTKSSFITPKTTACSLQFMIQLFDFLRSFYELNIKKTEEWNKSISNNALILTDVISKELNSEENNLLNFWYKFSKELISFKEKNTKFIFQKEKILSNIQQVKGDILKTSDDPNNFSKYEAKLHNLRIDESNMNDSINDNHKKYKKYLDENFELLKSNIRLFKMKEAQKFKEIKDSINNVIKSMEKVVFHLNDFLSVGTQIFSLNETKDDVKQTLIKYLKEFHVEESQFISYFENNQESTYKAFNISKSLRLLEGDSKGKIIFLNKENTTIVKDLRLEFLKEDEINDLKDKLSINKSNIRPLQIEASLLNSYSDEFIESFHCSFIEKNVYYGRITLTYKKLYLKYFPGPISINTTIIEIPIVEVVSIEKRHNIVYDNSIIIKTKTQEYFLANLIFRDKCYRKIYKLLVENGILDEKHKSSSNINSETHSIHENHNLQNNFHSDMEDNITSSPINEKITDKSSKALNLVPSLANSITDQENIENLLTEINFIEKLKEINTLRSDQIKIRPTYQNIIVKDENLGDVPLYLVFKCLYDWRTICPDLDKGKNYITSFLEMRNDSNVKFMNDELYKDYIPQYFFSSEYNNDMLYSKIKSEFLNKFLEDIKNWNTVPYEFHYKYTHPCKKVFMGPDKLEVDDHFKIFFISPLCMIVETYTYLSGFMLVDTFITVAQVKFESDIYYDDKLKRFAFNTRVTVSHAIDFIKPNIFKSRAESEGIKEFTQLVNEHMIPAFKKVLSNQSKLFYDSMNNTSLSKNDTNQLKIQENFNLVIYQNNDKNLYTLLNNLLGKIDKLEKRIFELESNH